MHKKTTTRTNSEPQAAVTPGSGSPAGAPKPVSKDVIRLRAYQKWESAGKPGGDGIRFWLEAEKELSGTK
jgi:hypothetical protein